MKIVAFLLTILAFVVGAICGGLYGFDNGYQACLEARRSSASKQKR